MNTRHEAPGWDAIDRACEGVYGTQAHQHFASPLPPEVGGDSVNGISAYLHPATPSDPAHWHFVTYGLSELFEKHGEAPDVSGFGFEFTLRVKVGTDGDDPATAPPWALNFVSNLAKYVRSTGRGFAANHVMNAKGPLKFESATKLEALGIVLDPELGAIDTPNGRVEFLQIVGLTLDEHEAVYDWNAEGILKILGHGSPLWVTDLDRRSLLDSPTSGAEIRRRAEAEGSSMGLLFANGPFEFRLARRDRAQTCVLIINPSFALNLRRLLHGRIRHDQPFMILRGNTQVEVVPAAADRWEIKGTGQDESLLIELTKPTAAAIRADLEQPQPSWKWPQLPRFELRAETP